MGFQMVSADHRSLKEVYEDLRGIIFGILMIAFREGSRRLIKFPRA